MQLVITKLHYLDFAGLLLSARTGAGRLPGPALRQPMSEMRFPGLLSAIGGITLAACRVGLTRRK